MPVAAQLVFLRLRQALADSADENHDGVVLKYSRTDLEGLRVSSFEAVNVEALEVAIGQGMVEPLDLTTPLEESGFYLGVDVQPGHFVAGYLIPRPDETREDRPGTSRSTRSTRRWTFWGWKVGLDLACRGRDRRGGDVVPREAIDR